MKNIIISVISYYKWVFERDIHEEILSVEDAEKEETNVNYLIIQITQKKQITKWKKPFVISTSLFLNGGKKVLTAHNIINKISKTWMHTIGNDEKKDK